jgi:uncharacterized protein YjbI with pentapeptide repeats
MADVSALQAPDLPELEEVSLPVDAGAIDLAGARIAGDGSAVHAARVRLRECELHGVVLKAGSAPGLMLADVIMRDCGMSNVDGREGRLSRVELHRSRLVGFGLSRGDVRDLRVVDSSLQLASFASATLRNVVFERVNLAEASFMHARLESVAFVDCRLSGADFRHVTLAGCAMRGASLDGVLGVDSLRGLRMPWPDVLASAGALAVALGIDIESD